MPSFFRSHDFEGVKKTEGEVEAEVINIEEKAKPVSGNLCSPSPKENKEIPCQPDHFCGA